MNTRKKNSLHFFDISKFYFSLKNAHLGLRFHCNSKLSIDLNRSRVSAAKTSLKSNNEDHTSVSFFTPPAPHQKIHQSHSPYDINRKKIQPLYINIYIYKSLLFLSIPMFYFSHTQINVLQYRYLQSDNDLRFITLHHFTPTLYTNFSPTVQL